MSDRVLFATNKPASPTDAYGFSGFPFRMQTPATTGVSVGDGTEYPIALPLEDRNTTNASCARWFHRGKTIHLDTDFTYEDGSGVHPLNPQTLIKASFPTTELEIIQSAFVQRSFLTDTNMDLRMFTTNRWISKDGGLFYPNFEIRSFLFDLVRLVSVDPTGATASITATFDGEDFTLYLVDSGVISFNLTFFDLTFTEFWPYDDGLGNPVYNTTNGLEL